MEDQEYIKQLQVQMEKRINAISNILSKAETLFITQIESVAKRLDRIESHLSIVSPVKGKQQVKNRRRSSDVPKTHKCLVPGCGKIYGSVSSARSHIKLKHPTYDPYDYCEENNSSLSQRNIHSDFQGIQRRKEIVGTNDDNEKSFYFEIYDKYDE